MPVSAKHIYISDIPTDFNKFYNLNLDDLLSLML